jgi:hypothetical protein
MVANVNGYNGQGNNGGERLNGKRQNGSVYLNGRGLTGVYLSPEVFISSPLWARHVPQEIPEDFRRRVPEDSRSVTLMDYAEFGRLKDLLDGDEAPGRIRELDSHPAFYDSWYLGERDGTPALINYRNFHTSVEGIEIISIYSGSVKPGVLVRHPLAHVRIPGGDEDIVDPEDHRGDLRR